MPAFPHSNVLLISADAVHSLLPPTIISQIEALLELNKVDQACALAEQHRKRLGSDQNAIDHVEVRPNTKLRTFICILTSPRPKNCVLSTNGWVLFASKILCSKMPATICSLGTLILESLSATSPTSEVLYLSREIQWRCLQVLWSIFRRLSLSKRSVSCLRPRNLNPPSDLT